jgi:hypothetical protein
MKALKGLQQKRRLAWLVIAIAGSHLLAHMSQAADLPRTPDGKPDFSGYWQALGQHDHGIEPRNYEREVSPSRGIVLDGYIPYQPWAIEQRDRNYAKRDKADPRLRCLSLGTPRALYFPEPFQILQRPRDITVLFQHSHRARTIHTNDSDHPPGGIGFWFGDSRARWEGDTLVVSVADFNGETWLDRTGHFHSDSLHVTERWEFLDADTIQYHATLNDEKVYTNPWSLQVLLYRHKEPGFQLIENTCYTVEYDKFYPYPAGADAQAGTGQ